MKSRAPLFVALLSVITVGGYFVINSSNNSNEPIPEKTDVVADDTSKPTSAGKVLFGFNANLSNSPLNYADVTFRKDIAKLRPQIIRWPGGSVSNDFNPFTGKADDGSGTANKIEDLALMVKETGCDVMFVLNMVTHTLDENLRVLKKAQSLGIPVRFVELGNEYNNINSPGRKKYPTPTDYANECVKWIQAIKAEFPGVEFGVIGENKGYKGAKTWNEDVLKVLGRYNVHLVYHCYPNPNDFSRNGMVDFRKLDSLLVEDLRVSGFDRQQHFWVTEFNVKYSDKQGVTARLDPKEHQRALLHLAKFLADKGADILCVHNLTGKEGVFNVKQKKIELMPTGFAMQHLLDSIHNK